MKTGVRGSIRGSATAWPSALRWETVTMSQDQTLKHDVIEYVQAHAPELDPAIDRVVSEIRRRGL